MSVIHWQYTRDPNDINIAIRTQDRDWEGLTSADQIINITFDSNHGCYVVFWRVENTPEIIRCRECKFWNPHIRECEGIGNWFGLKDSWSEYGFCYKAERKTDG